MEIPGLRIVPLHSGISRVTRPDGLVLGYLEPVDGRTRAKRLVRGAAGRAPRFVVIGDTADPRDAVELLLGV